VIRTALFFVSKMMLGLRPKEWATVQYRETYFNPERKSSWVPCLMPGRSSNITGVKTTLA